tara:strand:+ start:3010 stop:4167 length:1158 start_codon:yes stop_codon:yes gene_type:complete
MNSLTKINEINNSLAKQGVKIRLEKRGELLNFRGPLPSKDYKDSLKVQRISLSLPANEKGFKESEKLLQLLLLQLQHNQFDWQYWIKSESKSKTNSNTSILEDIQKFKTLFFNDFQNSKSISSRKTTWDSAYKPYLNRLRKINQDKDLELNAKLLCDVLKSYKENTRSRQQCSSSLAVFARFLNIDLPKNWKKISSGYGINKYNFRSLPDDKTIKELFYLIPNKKWRLVFGVMATYGLRNHEVFFSDYSSLTTNGDKILRVLPNTKTGEHQVWPFHPEWVELFELNQLAKSTDILPKINLDLNSTTLQRVGRRVSEQFRRYELPITPYDLRHAWAVRTIHIGLPDTVSARMMGHSVSIHNKTYHHWITKRDQQQAVDAALAKISN